MLWVAWYGEQRGKEEVGVLGVATWEGVTAIRMPGVVLEKLHDKWMASGKEVDESKVKELWTALERIQTERDITDSDVLRDDAFPRTSDRFVIEFNGDRLEILLGSQLPFDQSFYLETVGIEGGKGARQWIAQDISPEPGIYNVKTVYRSSAKYQRLKSLLQLKADDFTRTPEGNSEEGT